MAFGRELKDFIQAMSAMQQMGLASERARYYRARSDAMPKAFNPNDPELASNFNPRAPSPVSVNAPAGGVASPASEPGRPTARQIYTYSRQQGATHNEAVMLASSARAESSFNPAASHDGGAGYGLYGHGRSRWDDMEKFTGSRTPGWQDQTKFALSEIRGSTLHSSRINAATNPEELTEAQMHFLKPARYFPNAPRGGDNWGGRLSHTGEYWGLTPDEGPVEVAPRAIPADAEPVREDPAMARGGTVRSYARGGAVDDESLVAPENMSDADIDAEMAGDGVEGGGSPSFDRGAIPASVRPSMAGADGGQDGDLSLARAHDAGLRFNMAHFGLGQRGAAVGPDRELQQRQSAFMSGEGRPTDQDMAAAERVVDPNGELTNAQRRIFILEKGYRHYLEQGNPKAAAQFAASIQQYSVYMARKLASKAVESGRQGDVPGMIRNAEAAYDQVPDGQSVANVEQTPDGRIRIERQDAKTGKPTGTFELTPQELFSSALGLASGSAAWEAIQRAAATTETGAQMRAGQQQRNIEAIQSIASRFTGMGNSGQSRQPADLPTDSGARQAIPATLTVPDGFVAPGTETSGTSAVAPTSEPPDDAKPGAAVDELRMQPYPVPEPRLSDADQNTLVQLRALGPQGQAVAKQLSDAWKRETFDPWLRDRAVWMQDEKRRRDGVYTQRTEQGRQDRKQAMGDAVQRAILELDALAADVPEEEDGAQALTPELRQRLSQIAAMPGGTAAATKWLDAWKTTNAAGRTSSRSRGTGTGTGNSGKMQSFDELSTANEIINEHLGTKLFTALVNPDTLKPFTDAADATKVLGAPFANAARDMTASIARWNPGTPADTAADYLTTLISFKDPKTVEPMYEVGKARPGGVVPLHLLREIEKGSGEFERSGDTVLVPKEALAKIDTMRRDLAKHVRRVAAAKEKRDKSAADTSASGGVQRIGKGLLGLAEDYGRTSVGAAASRNAALGGLFSRGQGAAAPAAVPPDGPPGSESSAQAIPVAPARPRRTFRDVMSHPGNDPYTSASNIGVDAVVDAVRALKPPPGVRAGSDMPPSAVPAPPRAEERIPAWRGVPSWSSRAREKYPSRRSVAVEGDR